MKFFLLALPLLLCNCKNLGDGAAVESGTVIEESIITTPKPILPEGAVKADFLGNRDSLYVFVRQIDTIKETSLIAFENDRLPEIIIPESRGAQLQVLKLENLGGDVLLVNAKLKDTNFNEYYVFVWKDSVWKQPVNRFDIHKSNMSDTLVPISADPTESTKMLRYYSVFEMDRKSEKKYSWKLLRESVPISE